MNSEDDKKAKPLNANMDDAFEIMLFCVNQAIFDERERCAKIAEDNTNWTFPDPGEYVAAKIRRGAI